MFQAALRACVAAALVTACGTVIPVSDVGVGQDGGPDVPADGGPRDVGLSDRGPRDAGRLGPPSCDTTAEAVYGTTIEEAAAVPLGAIGTVGVQGYGDALDTAQSVLDGARAAFDQLGEPRDVVFTGHSQRGGASLFAQGLAATYAPEITSLTPSLSPGATPGRPPSAPTRRRSSASSHCAAGPAWCGRSSR